MRMCAIARFQHGAKLGKINTARLTWRRNIARLGDGTSTKNQLAELLNTASSSSNAKSASSQQTSLSKPSDSEDARKRFLDYMKQTPAQRWQEAWLKAHGMTKEQFDALPAYKKAALMDEMKQEMQDQIRQAAENSKDGKNSAPAIGLL